jgi:NAD(P)H-dependent FMN reductase
MPRLSESTEFAVPLKNIVALLIAVSAGTIGYMEAIERINTLEHRIEIALMDVKQNTVFRIKWPRGELGSLPADARQDLLIEALQRHAERLGARMERVDDLQVRLKLVEQKLDDQKK